MTCLQDIVTRESSDRARSASSLKKRVLGRQRIDVNLSGSIVIHVGVTQSNRTVTVLMRIAECSETSLSTRLEVQRSGGREDESTIWYFVSPCGEILGALILDLATFPVIIMYVMWHAYFAAGTGNTISGLHVKQQMCQSPLTDFLTARFRATDQIQCRMPATVSLRSHHLHPP